MHKRYPYFSGNEFRVICILLCFCWVFFLFCSVIGHLKILFYSNLKTETPSEAAVSALEFLLIYLWENNVISGKPLPPLRWITVYHKTAKCAELQLYSLTEMPVSKRLNWHFFQVLQTFMQPVLITGTDFRIAQPSTQAFSSRSHDLARNFVTSPNGITRERLVNNPKSKMAPSAWRRVIKLFKILLLIPGGNGI